jgi:hypothetical protein
MGGRGVKSWVPEEKMEVPDTLRILEQTCKPNAVKLMRMMNRKKIKEVSGGRIKLYTGELHNLYSSRRTSDGQEIGNMRNAYKIF